MNKQQEIAFHHPCRLAVETVHPQFGYFEDIYTLRLTVNSGHE